MSNKKAPPAGGQCFLFLFFFVQRRRLFLLYQKEGAVDFLVFDFFRFSYGNIFPVMASEGHVGFFGSAAASFEDEDFTV